MDSEKLSLLKRNIQMLEKGITLNEYLEKEEQIKIDGDTRIYNKYGFYVIYNKTKNLYVLDGGNDFSGFAMATTIHQFFVTNNGCGNPYMHKHYVEGDEFILRFLRFDSQMYSSMAQFRQHLENHYDSIGETYFDYIKKIQDKKHTKNNRPKSYNKYYNGAKQEEPQQSQSKKKTNSIAATLLRLENKSTFLYNLLNAIADLLVKPIPIYIWLVLENKSTWFNGENVIQNGILLVIGIISGYLAAIICYLGILLTIQIIKLFVCTYKPLVIHFRVFDIIIKLSSKKIWDGNDRELQELLYNHECIVEERKGKRQDCKSTAYENKRQRELDELEFAQEQYERAKVNAQWSRDAADYNLKKASEGGTLFSSVETKLEDAKSDAASAEYHEQVARDYEEIIRKKKRSLGIK